MAKVSGNPENPRNLTKINTPHIIEKIIATSLAVSINAKLSELSFKPLITAMISTTNAPKAPASVGVAQPA